jgi:hypothetical protein
MRPSSLITLFCSRRRWFAACAWVLLAVIAGAHSLSFVHRIAHAHSGDHAAIMIAADDNHFNHDEGSAGCLAFDAMLSLAQFAPPAAPPADAVLYGATTIASLPTSAHPAQPRTAANARAPPGESSPLV